MRRLLGTIGALLLLSACVPLVPGGRTLVINPLALSIVRGAPSGQRQRLDTLISLNPDCSSVGYWTVRILVPPMRGRVDVEYGEAYSNFPKVNPRSVCNKRQSPATLVDYTSYPGYVGPDTMTIEALAPDGELRTVTFRLHVL